MIMFIFRALQIYIDHKTQKNVYKPSFDLIKVKIS